MILDNLHELSGTYVHKDSHGMTCPRVIAVMNLVNIGLINGSQWI